MKTYLFLIIIFISGCVTDPISTNIATGVIANQVDKSTDKLTASIDRAVINGDYLLEKNLRSLDLYAKSLLNKVQEELGTNREFASRELVSLSERFSNLIDQAEGGILNVEDFIVLDIQNVINQIPFKNDKYIIKRVTGYSQKFKPKGQYDFTLVGNAFSPDMKYDISVNGSPLDQKLIYGGAAANTLRFSVPVELLNNKFDEFEANRVPINVDVISKKKTFTAYDGDIILLPKYPIKYRITETVDSFTWSGQNNTKECSRTVGATGKNGKWENEPMKCVVNKPDKQRFTGQISKRLSVSSHAKADDLSFTEGNTVATSTCHNECHDCSRTCTWVAGVEEKVFGPVKNVLALNPLSLNAQTPKVIDETNYVSFGTYDAVLSDVNSTFTVAVEYFNGTNHVLHPQKIREGSISINIDSDDNANRNYQRLIVNIDNPFK